MATCDRCSREFFKPNWASPPGDTIEDVAERKNMAWYEVAFALGMTKTEYAMLIDGRGAIDVALAERLSDLFGNSAQFWLNREAQYREAVARLYKGGDQESR